MNETLLIVDDEKFIREMTVKMLEHEGNYRVLEADSYEEAVKILSTETVDVVISDLKMPTYSGLDLLRLCKERYPDVLFILITGVGTIESSVTANNLGAWDYITKPFQKDKLIVSIKNALKQRELTKDKQVLQNLLSKNLHKIFIAKSNKMKEIYNLVEKVAPTEASPILIYGETGSGKEIIARSIHELSHRKDQPFIELNCTAIQENLIENELFGHEKGAFTGAIEQKKGLFEIASEGTLFLDEIGDMSLPLQSKLLRVLESGQFYHLGGITPIQTRARIIAATNKNLRKAVEEKTFREDLYYRLNLININLPPLREHPEDIIPLVFHFMAIFNQKFKKGFTKIEPEAENILKNYKWKGNIRELRNVIERIILVETGDTIKVRHLPIELLDNENVGDIEKINTNNNSFKLPDNDIENLPTLEELEKSYILHILKKTNNNRSLTAKILNINRKTLWEKLKIWGIKE